MANSTTNLDAISVSQSAKEVTANELFDALSPASLFGRRASACAGLVWGYYGGPMVVDGALTPIGNSTIALAANSTVYVEASRGGTVTSNATEFTAGRIPLYTVITGASTVSSYTDHRAWAAIPGVGSRVSLSVAGSSNVTLTAAQARAGALEFAGILTGSISVIVPDGPQSWVVTNNTTGGSYTVTVRTASGAGVIVARTATVGVVADGTDALGINAAESSMSLDQLSDVDTAGSPAAVSGDVLTFDGSVWRAQPVATSSTAGRHSIPIMASSISPSASGGCATITTRTSAANMPDIITLDFDASAEEYAQFAIPMPKKWNLGTITAKFIWSHGSTTTNFAVIWGLQAVAVSNDDTIAVAYGTAQTAIDTGGTTDDLYVSPETSAITIAGTPAAEDVVYFRVYRKAADGSDTLAVDARLIGVVLYITTSAETDA